ncbi:hypothetical protein HMPREF9144_1474 [Prevotella pallens ATCC 700821]|uniref:Uncharacterized protein n=1 Tax=Prevotella pallens ATCC 700821 TaxID=997353 RepID=F9DII4_9BACT|nr:hypothetical protein HMPREF9144_1474 [Prevotella pallens ATCC 700821]
MTNSSFNELFIVFHLYLRYKQGMLLKINTKYTKQIQKKI